MLILYRYKHTRPRRSLTHPKCHLRCLGCDSTRLEKTEIFEIHDDYRWSDQKRRRRVCQTQHRVLLEPVLKWDC